MRLIRAKGLALIAIGALCAGAARVPDLLELPPSRALAVTVNGTRATLVVDPDAPSAPILNPSLGRRLGLKPGLFGVEGQVGPVVVRGMTNVNRFDFGTGPIRRRTAVFERPFAQSDGAVGPGALPQPRISFVLRPPVAGERSYSLPLASLGREGLGTLVQVGDRKVFASIHLGRDESVATASAGAAIAAQHQGAFVGTPRELTFRFGVLRPVRTLRLARSLLAGPVKLQVIEVRTADYGSVGSIRDTERDPSEIVVTARTRRGPKPLQRIALGRAAFASCSAILFDKPAKAIRLWCR